MSSRRSAARSSWSGAGLPHLPSVLSASKSYSERLFRYARIDRLDREAADQALLAPAEREDVLFKQDALDALYAGRRRLPVLRAGLRQGDLGRRRGEPDHRGGRRPSPRPRRKASWPSGSSAHGTSAPPRPSASTCARWPRSATSRCRRRHVADELGRKPSSLSPARDGLIKKGLIYSSERGLIAFTVPHFGKFLRSQPV